MKEQLQVIRKVLSRKSYFSLFIISGLLYGLLYAVLTNLIDIRYGISNIVISFTWTSASFFIILSILGGLLISLQVFAFRKKQKEIGSMTAGATGAFLSFFTTTCPFCKPLLISLIGFSGSLAILKYGLILAIISALLLLIAIYFVTSSMVKKNCCSI